MGGKSRFRFPGGERALTACVVFMVGLAFAFVGIHYWMSQFLSLAGWLLLVLGLPLAASGVGLWFCRGWARWTALPLVVLLAVTQVVGLVTKAPTMGRIALLVGFLAMAWSIHRDFSPASLREAGLVGGDEEEKPLVSLVLLLRKPRYLEAGMLARYCEAAWGGPFHALRDDEKPNVAASDHPSGSGWVGGRSPFLFVGSNHGVFLVHNHDQPYFDDPTSLADSLGDLRIRQVLEENRGWLAVDFMESANPDPSALPSSYYPHMARLVAELAGPDCQAIYQPDGNRFNHWDESLEARLRSGDVAQVFEEPTRLPVVEVADDDPRMLAAVEEASRRWPEFVAALERKEGEAHAVKVPLTHGDSTELIWVDVVRIDNDRIHGRIGNDPVDLGDLRLGSGVDVPVVDVRDWVYVVEGQPRGMFGTKVLVEVQRERAAQSE